MQYLQYLQLNKIKTPYNLTLIFLYLPANKMVINIFMIKVMVKVIIFSFFEIKS